MQLFVLRGARGMYPNWSRWLGVGAAFLVLITCSCSRSATPSRNESRISGESSPNPFLTAPDLTTQRGTVFDVKFSPNTMRIEPQEFIHSLRSFSPDHTIYIFDKSSEVARRLQTGKIMFIPGLTLQKIIAVTEEGPDLVVAADEAPLTEAIESGTIKWDHAVNFQQIEQQQKRAAIGNSAESPPLTGLDWLDARLVPSVYAAPGAEDEGLSYGEEKNWNTQVEAHADASGLNFKLHLDRKADSAGISASIDVTGHMDNFQNATSIVVQNNQVDSFRFHNSGMNAKGNVTWKVFKDTPGTATNEEDLRLPTSFSVPLVIGGIPFSLELSEAVMFKPGFTSKGELAKGGFSFQISGDNGFKVGGGANTDESNSSGDSSIDDHGGVSPVAPFAVLIAVTAPRIELSTGPKAAFERLRYFVPPTLADRLNQAAAALQKTTFGKWFADKQREVLKAKGEAHVQFILSTSATIGGAAALIPCQRTQLVLTGNAGVSANLFKLVNKDYEVNFVRKDSVVVVPPVKACQV